MVGRCLVGVRYAPFICPFASMLDGGSGDDEKSETDCLEDKYLCHTVHVGIRRQRLFPCLHHFVRHLLACTAFIFHQQHTTPTHQRTPTTDAPASLCSFMTSPLLLGSY